MRLPDSFLDEIRARLSLSQVVGRRVTWDLRKSNQAKGDWWAPCPFHQEKSPSFHVDDQKGFFYCFGCGAKGNLFGFVQQQENVGFMEAVELLAREAGMEMPRRDPREAQAADRRTQLAELCEEALRFFRTQLKTGAAAEARDYLRGRSLSPDTLDRFEIGFAPNRRMALRDHLMQRGVAPNLIEAAGLATPASEGDPRDRFINRITFPIRDGRGRCIGFGGRAMNPDAKAKYLNSPETELFDKGANLYNLARARSAAGKGQTVVVAEGYMDVIALAQAGFEAAVAPLGTAVTDRQLRLLWRVSPEPVVALDGDAAGQRAGLRLADLALPMIAAGQSLRFAILPEGQDPDDLIRAGGPEAMRAVLEGAVPMSALLWRRATEGKVLDSPERRAAFDAELRALVRRIEDPNVRRHYGEAFARQRADLFGPEMRQEAPRAFAGDRPFRPRGSGRPGGGRGGGAWQPPALATVAARGSALAQGAADPDRVLEQVALAGLVLHPALLEDFAEALERGHWAGEGHGRIAQALLAVDPVDDPAEARAALERAGCGPALEALLALAHVRVSPAARPGAGDADAAACVRDAFARLEARRGVARETLEAIEDFEDGGDEAIVWRLGQALRRRDEATRAPRDEETGGDDAAGMSEFLQGLLDAKVWEKQKRK
ncbi:DNA primase [Jannaschia sp. W003]|uniref:DNA primase n=1 Tax=Jannaschia sp. W003 TaxID=2867012 RepID=UPI0021A38AF3|nr:DNA primase [Jannaschia sp. W003]UWQ20027.1 DNA primase [Jannaschia sp. W003]